MKSAILIKSIKKYKNYNLSVDKDIKNILLSGETVKSDEKNIEIDAYKLVKKTNKLGKKLYNIILEELEKRTYEINRAIKSNINNKQIVKEFTDNFIRIEEKNYSHFKFAHDFYIEAFNLLNKLDPEIIKDIDTPELISIQLGQLQEEHLWGIRFEESYSGKNISRSYQNLLNKLEEKIDNIDCRPLLDKIDYMIFDIRHLFTSIFVIEKTGKNKQITEMFDAVKEWCEDYGMPFWTDRKSLAPYIMDKIITEDEIFDNYSKNEIKKRDDCMSFYELSENTCPIINLISISISIYLFSVLWKKYINNEKMTADDNQKLKIIKYIIGNPYSHSNSATTLIEDAEQYHSYIMNNMNRIYDLKLEIYERKIPYTINNKKVFYNVREYESPAIAAWDVFFHDYLGNIETTKPLPYCNECHKQIQKGHSHTIEDKTILCDECFEIRKSEKNRARVQKYREKNK